MNVAPIEKTLDDLRRAIRRLGKTGRASQGSPYADAYQAMCRARQLLAAALEAEDSK